MLTWCPIGGRVVCKACMTPQPAGEEYLLHHGLKIEFSGSCEFWEILERSRNSKRSWKGEGQCVFVRTSSMGKPSRLR